MKNKISWKFYKIALSLTTSCCLPCFAISCSEQEDIPQGLLISGADHVFAMERETYTAIYVQSAPTVKTIWDVNNKDLAEITESGVLKAKKQGEVIISASLEGHSKIYAFKKVIIDPVPEEVKIIGETSVAIGYSQKFDAVITPAEASQHVTWFTNSPEDEATITQDGLLTVYKKPASGNVIIWAISDNDKIQPAALSAKVTTTPDSIKIENWPETGLSVHSDPFKCTASFEPSGAKPDIKWKVEPTEFASIDKDTGLLTAIKDGTVTVTAYSSTNPNRYDQKEVEIFGLNPIAIDFEDDPWSTFFFYYNKGFDVLKQVYNKTSFIGLRRKLVFDDGVDYYVQVIDENIDTIYGSTETASLTFCFDELLVNKRQEAPIFVNRSHHVEPPSIRYTNAWYTPGHSSIFRNYANNAIKCQICNALGYSINDCPIKPVTKKTIARIKEGGQTTDNLYESKDYVFPPALSEIFGDESIRKLRPDLAEKYISENNGRRYKYFADNIPDNIDPAQLGSYPVLLKSHRFIAPFLEHYTTFWTFRTQDLEDPEDYAWGAWKHVNKSILITSSTSGAVILCFCL